MADYNKTINLPKTDFPMRAKLAQREPGMLEEMNRKDLYRKVMERNKDKTPFILHDGPPYANGDIHIGTAMNKILKDMIIRYKNMTGHYAPYVPGWDTHGMPIETAIQKKGVKRNTMSVPEFRDKCRNFALDFLNRQREQFRRLGGIGDWEHPYITLKPEFEAKQIKVFGAMAEKGYIYQGLKPVYWCPTCETALAEAEVEYADDPVTTIYVKFKVHDDKGKLAQYGDLDKMYFVIWTTTTWTLPGNMAICLNPQLEYSLVKTNGEILIMATDLVDSVMKDSGITEYETVGTLFGDEFEYMTAYHPFMNRDSLIILGDHVTLDAGSGCVHTAPSFGLDDFYVCQRYDEIPTGVEMEVSVNAQGFLNQFAGPYEGLHVTKAHPVIFKDLVDMGAILSSADIVHSYPHCWRCKKPIIFRATQQWFASVDAIKDAAVKACDNITWKPEWGKERMISMIRERSDWCISRQRTWGVPIPIFFCKDCGKPYCTPESIEKISEIFGAEGSNAWWAKEAKELMPEGAACECGCKEFTKETDIMDVWFDSGSTWAAVCDHNPEHPELVYPTDLYLEGGDQYRGWFQSSMLTSIAARGVAPYKHIITHGWTVDGQGKAMHKSLGNTVAPQDIIKDYGADILRLWVSSSDYTQDMRISKPILKQLSDAYLQDPQHLPLYPGQPDRVRPGCRPGGVQGSDGTGSAGRWMPPTAWWKPPVPVMTTMTSITSIVPCITSAWWICPTSIWTSSRIACTALPLVPMNAAAHRPPSIASWIPWCGSSAPSWCSPVMRSGRSCPMRLPTMPRASCSTTSPKSMRIGSSVKKRPPTGLTSWPSVVS